jgi:hypothetical protein
MMNEDLVHKVLSRSIIGAARTVLDTWKPGLDEKTYERAVASISPYIRGVAAGISHVQGNEAGKQDGDVELTDDRLGGGQHSRGG